MGFASLLFKSSQDSPFMKRPLPYDARPRPLLAVAVYKDGRKVPMTGWTVNAGETHYTAIQRTAMEDGAEYAEIIATLH